MDSSLGLGNPQLGLLLRAHLQLLPPLRASKCTSGARSHFEQCWVRGKRSWLKTSVVHILLSLLVILCDCLGFHLFFNYN